jgi:hypothetical protein
MVIERGTAVSFVNLTLSCIPLGLSSGIEIPQDRREILKVSAETRANPVILDKCVPIGSRRILARVTALCSRLHSMLLLSLYP